MKIVYDAETDMLRITLREGVYGESEELADGYVVHFDTEGKPLSYEIEDASQQVDLTRRELSLHLLDLAPTSRAA